MKLAILLRTAEYRGDHSADVTRIYDLIPGETVEELARRLFVSNPYTKTEHDWIEIRVVDTERANAQP